MLACVVCLVNPLGLTIVLLINGMPFVFLCFFSFDLLAILVFLSLFILMDFLINVDTISMGMPILYFKGSQVEFSEL